MEKYMLELLGTCLKVNDINFQINHDREYWMIVDIRDDEEEWIDSLCVEFESEFDDHGVATGEYVFKVRNEAVGTIYKSTSAVDTCEFIKNEIEIVIDDACY
jgi:hypothetical protein